MYSDTVLEAAIIAELNKRDWSSTAKIISSLRRDVAGLNPVAYHQTREEIARSKTITKKRVVRILHDLRDEGVVRKMQGDSGFRTRWGLK